MPDSEQVNCMCCGEPVEECRCGGCKVCGGKACTHLQERTEALLRRLGEAIREQMETREQEGANR